MNIEIFLIWIGFALLFLVLAIKFSSDFKGVTGAMWIASGFMIFMSGLIVWVDGVQYKTGSQILMNGTSYVVSDTYSSLQGGVSSSHGLNLILVFIGLGILFSYAMFIKEKNDKEGTSYSEESD
jgi:uncharacterized membrane protein